MPRDTNKGSKPFCLRLTPEERAKLEAMAGGVALGTFIRDAILNGKAAPRRRGRNRHPVKDREALGRLLGALGQSCLASNLRQLARAANTGSLPVTPETEANLRQACADVRQLRRDLIRALGLSAETEP